MVTTQILSIVFAALFFTVPINSMKNEELMSCDEFSKGLAKAKKILQEECKNDKALERASSNEMLSLLKNKDSHE